MPRQQQLIARYSKHVEMLSFDECQNPPSNLNTIDSIDKPGSYKVACFDNDGSHLALGGDDGLALLNIPQNGDANLSTSPVCSIADPVLAVQFSPLNSFIALLSPFHHEKCPNNLRIYYLTNCCSIETPPIPLLTFQQRNVHKWCPQWADDESYACLLHNRKLPFILDRSYQPNSSNLDSPLSSFDSDTTTDDNRKDIQTKSIPFTWLTAVTNEIQLCNVKSFALSPGKGQFVAAFCEQPSHDKPTSLQIYNKEIKQTIIEHNMFNIDEADFKWNITGTMVLANCQDNRSSSSSYYGKSSLYLFDTTNNNNGTSLTGHKDDVQKLPIYYSDSDSSLSVCDFCWSPSIANEFCVVFDKSMVALFDANGCKRIKTFGCQFSARNGLLYHPSGLVITFTGSGNVKGNFETWLRLPTAKPKNIKPISGQIDAPYATMFKWCPTKNGSFYLLVATTFPRLRQENGYRIFDLVGQMLVHVKVPENNLCDVLWRPLSLVNSLSQLTCSSTEKSLTETVKRLKGEKEEKLKSGQLKEKPKKYIPPHLRQTQTIDPKQATSDEAKKT